MTRERLSKPVKEILRTLRKESTRAESLFWNAVRNRKVAGCKFFRQHPLRCFTDDRIRIFIADFYCAEKRLIVEIDGGVHELQREYDMYRTQAIEQYELEVIRFTNTEIETNLGQVIDILITRLQHTPSIPRSVRTEKRKERQARG